MLGGWRLRVLGSFAWFSPPSLPPPSFPLGHGEYRGRVTVPVPVKLLEKVFAYVQYLGSFYRHDCSTPPFLARTGTGPNTHADFELAPLLARALLYFDALSLGGLFRPRIG